MRVFISCGETSGDNYAANIVKSATLRDDIQWYGNGGEQLADAGAELLFNVVEHSTIGFIEPLAKIPYFLNVMRKTKRFIKSEHIDAVVIIDHQGFNIPLAKWCKQHHIPVISFIAPQFWMWGNKASAEKFMHYCQHIFCIFEKEYLYYAQIDAAKVSRVDHPLVALLPQRQAEKSSILGVFPGSRIQEIKHCFSTMLAVMKTIKERYPEIKIELAIASDKIKQFLAPYMDPTLFTITHQGRDLIARAKCSLVTSGTVSLEHALIKTPCVAIYKLGSLSYFIAASLVLNKIKENCSGFIALPNILAERKICPEFLQSAVTHTNVTNAVDDLLTNKKKHNAVLAEFAQIESRLVVGKNPFNSIGNYLNTIKTRSAVQSETLQTDLQ
ncbi:MAG: hypothetical protein VW397_05440 [Candidatus Margulisiibacteriota bacterium]